MLKLDDLLAELTDFISNGGSGVGRVPAFSEGLCADLCGQRMAGGDHSVSRPHGLAVKEELEEYYEREVHHGRLYPNLDTLVGKGLVSKGERDRRTNVYTLTERGEREIEARREWEDQYVSFE
jgi:PadR family transcriptional regulator, regulatory protein PadR